MKCNHSFLNVCGSRALSANSLAAGFLVLTLSLTPAAAQGFKPATQKLPDPSPSNTLLTAQQCPGQDEKAMGFALLFDGTLASFRSNFATWKSGNTTNTDIDAGYTLN